MSDAGDSESDWIILSTLSDEEGKDSDEQASDKGDETGSGNEAVAWEVNPLTVTIVGSQVVDDVQVVDDLSSLISTLHQPSKATLTRSAMVTEGSIQLTVKGKAGKRKVRLCPVCHIHVSHVKRHVFKRHLPWYVSPATSCWICGYQGTQVTGLVEH